MRTFVLTALALLAIPSTAQADIRATYSDGSVIEINDDGAFRSNLVSDGHVMMNAGGYNYLVIDDGGTPRVLDPVVVARVADAMVPDLVRAMVNTVPPLMPYKAGEVTVGERTGTGYRIDDEAKISFVVSADPELNLVGQVIAIQFDNWTQMQGPIGRLSSPLSAMFKQGAAIRFGDVELVKLEEVAIDDARFALPGEPLDYGATQELMLRMGLIKV